MNEIESQQYKILCDHMDKEFGPAWHDNPETVANIKKAACQMAKNSKLTVDQRREKIIKKTSSRKSYREYKRIKRIRGEQTEVFYNDDEQ